MSTLGRKDLEEGPMRAAESRAALRIVLLYGVFIALWDVLTDFGATAATTELPRLTQLLAKRLAHTL